MILYAALHIFFLHHVYADIMYIDAKRHIQGHANSQHTEDEDAPLPLSSLFAQSDIYNCLVENSGDTKCLDNRNNGDNKKEESIYYGPRFQNVHLALPVREIHEVGFTEQITVNNREMSITTLSNTPQVFEITNFLSANETDLMIDLANHKGLKSTKIPKSMLYMPETINERIFDQWDEDFDGHLSIKEMNNILELNPLLLSEEDLVKIIDQSKIDQDKNNYISFGELSHAGLEKFIETLQLYDKTRREFLVHGVEEAWLWHDEDELLAYEDLVEDFHERLKEISYIPTDLLEQSEPIQVMKHSTNAASHCQQDSMSVNEKPCCSYGDTNCRMCRYATILIFLNDVENGGELVFPLADNSTFSWENLKEDTIKKCEKTPKPKTSNLIIKPTRGKAVLWYNHLISPTTGWMSQMDPLSLTGITPIQNGNLWTAKFWININGDGVKELQPWKMGINWLKGNNKNQEIIEEMRNDYLIENEKYLHQFKKSYKYIYKDLDFSNSHILKPQTKEYDDEIDLPIIVNDIGKNENGESFNKETLISSKPFSEEFPSSEKDLEDLKVTSTDELLADLKDTSSDDLSEDTVIETIDNKNNIDLSEDIKDTSSQDNKNIHQEAETQTLKIVSSSNDFLKDYLPLGPPKRPIDPLNPYAGKIIENRLVRASLLLLEELDRDELEIIARSLHDKLQLACIPLIVNPISA